MFGIKDTIAYFRDLFLKYYATAIDYDDSHTMTADNVRNDLVSVIRKMLDEIQPIRERYFRHFKDGKYRLYHIAKDSETLQRMVVYQALYSTRGYWGRPETMFFERITHAGKSLPASPKSLSNPNSSHATSGYLRLGRFKIDVRK